MASEATKPPVKGILKRTKSASSSPPPAAPKGTLGRNDPRRIAIQHALILQDRKDTEAQILENITELLDLPYKANPPSSPDPSDVATFTSLIRIFQPSDYDDLIVERNLDENKCGYALCPDKRRKYKGAGTYKMINKGKKDFDIVETKELEKWCSQECTKRALWIKVQLNETAAWERVGLPDIEFELYPEKDSEKPSSSAATDKSSSDKDSNNEPERLAAQMARLQLNQDRKAAQDNAALALERGEDAKAAATGKVDVVIREKRVITEAEAPSQSDSSKGDSIEGYKAKFSPEG
ncbi:Putative RNA polymerase II subunit B1 CTD phosphatase RPAP2 [Cytospora mali]|uniref:RNA polymerase II subunit B1 CTD phosphatase RPAP2 homolog n=1 Tax=Cytospora mali TaxID=578113 RepID=A0A194UTQ0_CYTMA|nr:Putative RNA polymerase II subunit B1 CTD phosphatase RPAP2 [Valsa mali var. pyri (nom. inval.)]